MRHKTMSLRHEIPDGTETDPGEQKVQMDTISDAELLLRSSDRPEAFSMFYERHARDLLRFFARRTFDPETAADLTAETFAEAFASRGTFSGEGTDGIAWLYGVAHHQLSRFFRRGGVDSRARRKLGMPERDLSPDDFDRIEELVDFAPMRDAVEQALSSLPEEQRDATRLRVIEERPVRRGRRRTRLHGGDSPPTREPRTSTARAGTRAARPRARDGGQRPMTDTTIDFLDQLGDDLSLVAAHATVSGSRGDALQGSPAPDVVVSVPGWFRSPPLPHRSW